MRSAFDFRRKGTGRFFCGLRSDRLRRGVDLERPPSRVDRELLLRERVEDILSAQSTQAAPRLWYLLSSKAAMRYRLRVSGGVWSRSLSVSTGHLRPVRSHVSRVELGEPTTRKVFSTSMMMKSKRSPIIMLFGSTRAVTVGVSCARAARAVKAAPLQRVVSSSFEQFD